MVRVRDKALVLDASVVIKWFVEEEGSDRASLYLEQYKNNKFSIVVPTLLFYELGNILLVKKATVAQISKIMEYLHALHLRNVDIGYESFRKIFQNAQELSLTYYDASYATLMQRENCEFITADRRLFEKLKKKFTLARLL